MPWAFCWYTTSQTSSRSRTLRSGSRILRSIPHNQWTRFLLVAFFSVLVGDWIDVHLIWNLNNGVQEIRRIWGHSAKLVLRTARNWQVPTRSLVCIFLLSDMMLTMNWMSKFAQRSWTWHFTRLLQRTRQWLTTRFSHWLGTSKSGLGRARAAPRLLGRQGLSR